LDRLWSEAHVAADAQVLDPAFVAALAPDDMSRLRLRLHPAARWRWSEETPAYSIWRRTRAGDADLGDLAWHGEGALLTRPHGEVRHLPIERSGTVFLEACARNESIHAAVLAALDADEHADLSALIRQLLQAGAFTGLEPANSEEPCQ
jgi:hypothetical protein